MMIFMMRGMMHGGHGGHETHGASDPTPDPATARKLAAMELEIARLRGDLDVDGYGPAEAEAAGRESSRA